MRGGFYHRFRTQDQEDIRLRDLNRECISLLWYYLRPRIKTLGLSLLAMLGVAGSAMLTPYLLKIAVDDYIVAGRMEGLVLVVILMIGTAGVSWFSSYWETFLSASVGQGTIRDLRRDLFSHIQKLSVDFFASRQTGSIMSRITADVNAISELVRGGLVSFVSDMVTLLGIIIIMVILHPTLALVSFTAFPVIYAIIKLLGHRMRKAFHEVQASMAAMSADVQENVSGIRAVQSLARERGSIERFEQVNLQQFRASMKAVMAFGLFFPGMTVAGTFGTAIVLWFGGLQVAAGNISPGVLLAFLGYIRRLFMPLRDLSQVYNTFQSAAASLDRINNYLKITPSVQEPVNPVSLKGEGPVRLQLGNVTFGYDETPVLKDLNLNIEPGEVLGLVGATGAGKTTLVNLITRFYDVDAGCILLDGVDIRQLELRELRRIMAVIPQDVFLFPRSIAENIAYGNPEASKEQIIDAAKKVGVHQFISSLPRGYETDVGEEGIRLSGGQKQLLALAQAMLGEKRLLILDEATSSVDAFTEKTMQNALQETLLGKTVIIIAHRFATLTLANRIAVMGEGKIIDSGLHEELMERSEEYRELYLKQQVD